MKVIFLDIDGVLNYISTTDEIDRFLGIDDKLVKNLKEIVDKTNAEIVLCSSWKKYWDKDKSKQGKMANYLDMKLEKQGLKIIDKTDDNRYDRGHGIQRYIQEHNIEKWCVLDDEVFFDYEDCDIIEHLVKTEFFSHLGGLRKEHVDKAIVYLNMSAKEKDSE